MNSQPRPVGRLSGGLLCSLTDGSVFVFVVGGTALLLWTQRMRATEGKFLRKDMNSQDERVLCMASLNEGVATKVERHQC